MNRIDQHEERKLSFNYYQFSDYFTCSRRIIDNRIEKSIKGRRIGYKSSQGGGGPGRYCPGVPSDPPPFPTPSQAWGTYVVCGCCWADTTARANALTQIVPNVSSLYTLFYSVIYNSVLVAHRHSGFIDKTL